MKMTLPLPKVRGFVVTSMHDSWLDDSESWESYRGEWRRSSVLFDWRWRFPRMVHWDEADKEIFEGIQWAMKYLKESYEVQQNDYR